MITIFSFTKLPSPEGLKVNEMAPDFSAKDQYGKKIVLNELLSKGSVVLVFYRGEWCPFCNKQLLELQDSLALIKKTGATLIAISPEKEQYVSKTVQKTKATYSILSDDSLKIMTAYKVAFMLDEKTTEKYRGYGVNLENVNGNNGNNLPVPAVYVINKQGKITYRYFDVDYKKRVSVHEILKYL